MSPQDPKQINWQKVKADVERAASAFNRRTGFEVSSCEFAGWDAVGKAFALYDADNETGATFSTYYTRAIYNEMWKDYRTLGVVVSRPQKRRADETDRISSEDIADYAHKIIAEDTINTVNADEYPQLALALAALDEKDRKLIEMKVYERKTFEEIGEALGLTHQGARYRYQRALTALRKTGRQFVN